MYHNLQCKLLVESKSIKAAPGCDLCFTGTIICTLHSTKDVVDGWIDVLCIMCCCSWSQAPGHFLPISLCTADCDQGRPKPGTVDTLQWETRVSKPVEPSPSFLQLPPACTQLNIRMRRRAGSPTPRITWQLLLPPRSHRSDHDQTRSRRKQTRWATVQALCFCCWAFLYWVAWPFRPFLNTWWSRYRAGMVLFRRHSTADTSRLMRRLGKTSTTGEYQIYNSKSSCLLHNFCTVWSTHELYLVVAAKLNAEWQLALYSRLLSPKYCSYKPFTILTLEFWLFCGGRPQHPFSILRVKTRELLLLRHCVDKLFSVQVCGECQWPKNGSSGSVASKFQNNTNCDCRFCSF